MLCPSRDKNEDAYRTRKEGEELAQLRRIGVTFWEEKGKRKSANKIRDGMSKNKKKTFR